MGSLNPMDKEDEMAYWLYQMSIHSENGWSHDEYEKEVREGTSTEGMYALKVRSPSGIKPQKGDMAILFFAWSGDPKGGICGWAEVLQYDEAEETIDLKPREPTDRLKVKPILNETVKDITKRIRRGFFQGNIWEVPPDLVLPFKQMIEG